MNRGDARQPGGAPGLPTGLGVRCRCCLAVAVGGDGPSLTILAGLCAGVGEA